MKVFTEEHVAKSGNADNNWAMAFPDFKNLAVEILNHLYTPQDIARIRYMAKECLNKINK